METIFHPDSTLPSPLNQACILDTELLEKKIPGARAAWEKNQEPDPLEKGAGAAKKFTGFPALHLTENIIFLKIRAMINNFKTDDQKFQNFAFMANLQKGRSGAKRTVQTPVTYIILKMCF